jgi:hypothetical protein
VKFIVPEKKAVIVIGSVCIKKETDKINITDNLSITRDTTAVFEELEYGVIKGISIQKANNIPYVRLKYDALTSEGATFSILGTRLQLQLKNPTLVIRRERSSLDIEFDYYIESIYTITGNRERFEDSDVIYILSASSIFDVIDFMKIHNVKYVIVDYRLDFK